jgi:hypothetical protein
MALLTRLHMLLMRAATGPGAIGFIVRAGCAFMALLTGLYVLFMRAATGLRGTVRRILMALLASSYVLLMRDGKP